MMNQRCIWGLEAQRHKKRFGAQVKSVREIKSVLETVLQMKMGSNWAASKAGSTKKARYLTEQKVHWKPMDSRKAL